MTREYIRHIKCLAEQTDHGSGAMQGDPGSTAQDADYNGDVLVMVINKVIAILCEQFDVDENEITEQTSLVDDLEADSIDSFEITMALEDAFDIEIPDEDAEELRTVGDIVSYIEANI